VTFFVASSATSSAYLTASEVFPLEIRALAIAIFYACGTFAGGVFGPALYGYLVGAGSRTLLFWGYIAGAGLIICGGLSEVWIGVDAERKSLEPSPRRSPAGMRPPPKLHMADNKGRSLIALDALNFCNAGIQTGLGPFMSIFYTSVRHWNPGQVVGIPRSISYTRRALPYWLSMLSRKPRNVVFSDVLPAITS
jgi:MFS family permease